MKQLDLYNEDYSEMKMKYFYSENGKHSNSNNVENSRRVVNRKSQLVASIQVQHSAVADFAQSVHLHRVAIFLSLVVVSDIAMLPWRDRTKFWLAYSDEQPVV
ncbi:hypothetical protein T07_2875 [Trichinella nelsoni]|uniref:Uncharacterized protein n=1 Tax=Trichinella nelsoni TaxID=6336 RepID=A0A0V0RDQ5_9BILA|nr:hypothetical protein T07_2875 [Trichinella nelsoni]